MSVNKAEMIAVGETRQTKDMGAIILAGGKSSRMGRDKVAVLFRGEPLLIRVIRILKEMFGEVIVVKNQDIPFELDVSKVVQDEVPYQGPLGGIAAGLKASSYETNLVVAVDMPLISPQVVGYLAGLTGEADVVVPKTGDGLEPLFAFYSKRCLPAIEKTLKDGERKVISFFPHIKLRVVNYAEVSHLDGADKTFVNINTERELKRVEHNLDEDEEGCFKVLDRETGDPRMPVERPVTIYLNSEELVTVQTSMEHLDELACGFLVSEGMLQDRGELVDIRVNEDRGEVRVRTAKPKENAVQSMGKRFVTSGCGKGFSFVSLGDAMGIARLTSEFRVAAEDIPIFMREFLLSSRRPGMHSSALARDGKIKLIRQDIGRHNTVDMVLGRLFLDGIQERDVMLFTTGRISYEMVVKAAKARIPVLVSRTAATTLAVELANRLGIEIIGYVRGEKMKVYTGASRLLTEGEGIV
ncbi:MAG: formate dehydrogenase accessory sulfurtransferase FdhD [Firmicutes bacterium]|nr:formate dehydrogenase accessory sulfurtransferase FdhD [Bacillota bacterium]